MSISWSGVNRQRNELDSLGKIAQQYSAANVAGYPTRSMGSPVPASMRAHHPMLNAGRFRRVQLARKLVALTWRPGDDA
jgi:hypothetical protein